MREVKQHSFFASVNWQQLCEKKYEPKLVPSKVMQIKFFKEHNRWPTEEDDEYVFDTRFFSPKQTRRPVEPV